jgi:hypothetical protein
MLKLDITTQKDIAATLGSAISPLIRPHWLTPLESSLPETRL